MNDCCMKPQDNTMQVFLAELKRELLILKTDTTARLLIQDGKIAETCVYIKQNLSNYLRDMFSTMENAGELDEIIRGVLSSDLTVLTSKTENIISVEQFGAKGDGITDDTKAINNALKCARNRHCTIVFPKKTYVVSGYLELYSNTVIDLNFATIKVKGTTLFLNNSESLKTAEQGALKNIIIKNGTFKGVDNNLVKFALMHADNVRAENLVFDDCMYGNHIFDLGGCSNVHIDGCRFTNVSLRDTGEYVELIQLDYSAYNGMPYFPENSVAYDFRACKNIHISNCVFEKGNGSHYPNGIGAHGFFEEQHDNIVVENCIFKGWTYGAIRPLRCTNVTIVNNRFETDDLSGTIGAIVIEKGSNGDYIFKPCENVLISGNTFVSTNGSKRRFVFIYGESATEHHRRIVIANNKYKGTYNGYDTASGSDFAQLNFVDNVLISGNVIESAKNVLFVEASATNTSLINNNLVSCRTKITKPSTVFVEDGIKSILCASCGDYTTSSVSYEKLPLSTVKSSYGNKLTLSGGSIVIGSGVTQVKVSAIMSIKTPTGEGSLSSVSVQRVRGGNSVSLAEARIRPIASYETASIPTTVINVAEGDLIELHTQSSSQGAVISANTNITVEVIN